MSVGPGLTCSQEPCLGPWHYNSKGLCWCLWLLLPLKVRHMPRVSTVTWVHFNIQQPCCDRGQADLMGLWCHLWEWWHPVQATAKGHVWVCSPTSARVCVDIHASCYHQMLYRCPYWSEWPALTPRTKVTSGSKPMPRTISGFLILPQPESVLMSVASVTNKDTVDAQGRANTWGHFGIWRSCYSVLIWVACAATWGPWWHPCLSFCQGVVFRSVILLKLGSVLISMAHVTTVSHRNHEFLDPRAVSIQHMLIPLLPLRELALTLTGPCSRSAVPTLRRDSPTPQYGCGRAGSTTLTKSATTQIQNQNFWVTHPNIHSIYDLPEWVQGLVLRNNCHRIAMTWGNRVSERSFSKNPIWWCTICQRP